MTSPARVREPSHPGRTKLEFARSPTRRQASLALGALAAALLSGPGTAVATPEGSGAADAKSARQDDPMTLNYLHVGRDGELFFAGLHQRLITAYRLTPTTLMNAWAWRTRIHRRAAHAAARGIGFTLMIVPEKLTIYPDRVAGRPLDGRAAPARLVQAAVGLGDDRRIALDLIAPFEAARDAPIYLATDSHWTHAGAHCAYLALCARFGARPNPRLREGRLLGEELYCGDLGTVASPRVTETVTARNLSQDAVRVEANAAVLAYEAQGHALALGEGARVVYRNASADADPRRLVVFGDSYCHHNASLRSGMMTQLLAETFREVHFVWNKSYDPDLVERVAPDLVLCEVAERYLFKLPAPRFDQAALERQPVTVRLPQL